MQLIAASILVLAAAGPDRASTIAQPTAQPLAVDANVAGVGDEGSSSRSDFRVSDRHVQRATAKWDIGVFFGEPTVGGSYKYTSASGRSLPSSTKLVLNVSFGNGGRGFIFLNPSVPKSGGGYGFNTTGSPDWSRFIVLEYQDGRPSSYFSADSAKAALRSGMSVTSWTLVTR